LDISPPEVEVDFKDERGFAHRQAVPMLAKLEVESRKYGKSVEGLGECGAGVAAA